MVRYNTVCVCVCAFVCACDLFHDDIWGHSATCGNSLMPICLRHTWATVRHVEIAVCQFSAMSLHAAGIDLNASWCGYFGWLVNDWKQNLTPKGLKNVNHRSIVANAVGLDGRLTADLCDLAGKNKTSDLMASHVFAVNQEQQLAKTTATHCSHCKGNI